MKKTLKTRKGLVPALLATLCSVGALTTVSYAWFTMGNQASVGEIDVNVQAADGMQISADAETWRTILPTEDFAKEGLSNQIPTGQISPISSVGDVTSGAQAFFLGTVKSDGKLAATVDTANYVKVDIYVKLDSDKTLYLDEGAYVTGGSSKSHYASRVSFVNQGVDTSGVVTTIKALNGGNSSVIWEPNAKHHISTVQNKLTAAGEAADSIIEYQGVKEAITNTGTYAGSAEQYAAHFDDVDVSTSTYSEAFLTTEKIELFDLKAGFNKITVYMWLEGQDADCENDIASGALSLGLKFITEAKQATPADPEE